MTGPVIPVSWGELVDKITILEIKTHRLRTPAAHASAVRELGLLRRAAFDASHSPGGDCSSHEHAPQLRDLPELEAALRAVNTRLWRIEDLIREREAAGDFGPGFIALARAVYYENDERGRIKRALNHLMRSAVVEEKQYTLYMTGTAPDEGVAARPES